MRKMCLLFICYITLIMLISGCTEKGADIEQINIQQENIEKIKSDLNATDYIVIDDLYHGRTIYADDKVPKMPVTDVEIIKINSNGNKYKLLCNVTQENNDYLRNSRISLLYEKSEEWQLDSYKIIDDGMTKPVSGVPDICLDEILPKLTRYVIEDTNVSGITGGHTERQNCTHKFDANKMTDIVNVRCISYEPACDVVMDVEAKYEFDKEWVVKKTTQKTVEIKWHIDRLCNEIWESDKNKYLKRTFRINNVDETKQTVDVSYGESDLTYNEICKYSLVKKQNNAGEYEEIIVIPITQDSYDIELHEHDVVYGVSLVPSGYTGKIDL